MTLDPEHAWQSALSQLQMEMPKASFDTWVRDTRLLSWDDGRISIGARNAYARDWLESRLTSTVERLLAGILNQEVSIEFVVDDDQVQDVKAEEVEPAAAVGAEQEMAEVQAVHRLRYDELVCPERIVALPGYFARIVPEIGPRSAWLYVGWRQAVWEGGRKDAGTRSRRVPVREIVRFSGLSRRTFFRAVEEDATWESLRGLVERTDEAPRWARGRDHHAHRLPNHYTVHLTLPLSRHDATAVQAWLEARLAEGMTLLGALHQANEVQDLVGELLPPLGIASSELGSTPLMVTDIVGALAGGDENLAPDLLEAAEALHRKIVSAFGTILLTHYFLETVIPQAGLSPAQAWLVALLRDRCYLNRETGEVRDEALVRGGYAEFAAWLGLTRPKTIWEWIRDERGPVGAFLAVLPGRDRDEPDSVRLRVRMDEPVFDGAIDTIGPGADGTHRMAEMAPIQGADDTHAWREWHGLKHLTTSQKTPERITSTTDGAPAAVPASWNLRKILFQARVHPKVLKDLLAKNASVQAFVAWLLFAVSPDGAGIQNPLAYALASLRETPHQGPGGAVDELAALPPAELVRLLCWSVRRDTRKFDFHAEPSGNELWDWTMGASERHGFLLPILLGGDGGNKYGNGVFET